jgi:hypothetical protein
MNKKLDLDLYKDVLPQINEWLTDCDLNDLAVYVGKIFGGHCKYDMDGKFTFEPNSNYGGAFNK